jgi:opacity protein-like surface antigen
MTRSLRAGALIALGTLISLPHLATAQGTVATYNLAGGIALPTGSYGDFNDSGFSLIGGIGMAMPGSPLRFRGEASYSQFNHKAPFDQSSRAGSFTGNAVYDFSMGPGTTFTPYAIGGIGFYGTRDFDNQDSQWNFGWNLGGGVRFPLTGFSVYVEARYHSVSNVDVHYAPIVFGVTF